MLGAPKPRPLLDRAWCPFNASGHAWSTWSYDRVEVALGVERHAVSRRCYGCGLEEASNGDLSLEGRP